MAVRIAKQRHRGARRAGLNEASGLANLGVGIGFIVDAEEIPFLLVALRNPFHCLMGVIPTMIGNANQSCGYRVRPPRVVHPRAAQNANAIHRCARIRRCDGKRCGVQARLHARMCKREIAHDIEHAALLARRRARQVVEIEIGGVVESDRERLVCQRRCGSKIRIDN